jgi:uncharacterized membrane protein YhaH (DUF805 family)
LSRAFDADEKTAGYRAASRWTAMAAGAFALMACGHALASDVYGIAEGLMMVLAMAVLFACIVVVTCVVAWRRCRQHGRRGLWYLLVPVEVVVLTTLTLNLTGGMPWARALGYPGLAVLALSLQLLAWGAAHLLHHEPADTSRQTRDDR